MWQLWIQNDDLQFEKVGPPKSTVDANLWLQVLGQHFGCEVRLRLACHLPDQRSLDRPQVVETERAIVTARSDWPGEK